MPSARANAFRPAPATITESDAASVDLAARARAVLVRAAEACARAHHRPGARDEGVLLRGAWGGADRARALTDSGSAHRGPSEALLCCRLAETVQMSVTFQVAGGGHLDIDFWVRRVERLTPLIGQVTDPRLAPMYTLTRKDTGTYSFTAEIEYVDARSGSLFCSSRPGVTGCVLFPRLELTKYAAVAINSASRAPSQRSSAALTSEAMKCRPSPARQSGVQRLGPCLADPAASTCMAVRCRSASIALTTAVMYIEDDGHTAPIEKEIRALSAALEAVKDEQEYIVVRERLHRDSASLRLEGC